MKSTIKIFLIFLFLCSISAGSVQSQIIKKPKINLKKGSKNLFKNIGNKTEPTDEVQEVKTNSRMPVEKSGEKRKMKPPDVNENIDEAQVAFGHKNYGSTRFAIEQAIVGIELEIGHQLLESMPEKVSGLSWQESEDQVYSSGMGFVGLNISREYYNDEKGLTAMVANNSALISSAQIAVSNPSMVAQNENMKIVTVQGNRSVLEYNEYSGYNLSVPFGQSSIFVLKCVNFDSEDEVMEAAGQFDISTFKKLLGEQ